MSKRSKKYNHGGCSSRWSRLNPQLFSIGSLFVLAKAGNAELLERIKPTLNMNADIFANNEVYSHTEIDTPFFTTPTPGADMSPDQAKFQTITDNVMGNPAKQVVYREEPLRLREDDLPTATR
ncbi:MAG: hypothetical protein ACKPKO_04000, partial [Candidatus Fonsibacter sp.]